MIGHNNGPPLGDITDVANIMRRYAWRKAHKAAWRTPPIEIVRLRQRAADALGLSYRDYTSILLDRGHRPRAIFFGLSGTLVRARDGAVMPGVETKLQGLRECALFVAGGDGLQSSIIRIAEVCRAKLTMVDGSSGPDKAAAVRHTLVAHRIPPSQAIMVGATVEDRESSERAKFARFFWAWEYFATSAKLPDATREVGSDASHAAFRLCRQRPGLRRPRHAPTFA